MTEKNVVLLDGYVDEPSAFGVPPYISFQSRYVAGAARSLGYSVRYLTVDQYRNMDENILGGLISGASLLVILAGCVVPGKYLRGTPISIPEIRSVKESYHPRTTILGGAAARYGFGGVGGSELIIPEAIAHGADLLATQDLDASVFDYLAGGYYGSRKRTLQEWNIWAKLGAGVVTQHPDFPSPLFVEVETSRGCPRYITGGCSFCVEPQHGLPVFREPHDIVEEVEVLYRLGVRNIRLGGQSDVYAYMGGGVGETETVRPNVEAWERLFTGVWSVAPELKVLHLDNANPAVVAIHPEQSRRLTKLFVRQCTSGNLLPLGLESADPVVTRQNNLNATTEQTLDAVRLINELGRSYGPNGLPRLLPGLNFVFGLKGETKETYKLNYQFLQDLVEENLLLRRVNLRQVTNPKESFKPNKNKAFFKRYKRRIRENIDRVLLQRLFPIGHVLRDVYLEKHDRQFTHGRQVGSYALLNSIPFNTPVNRFVDVLVTGHGYRSLSVLPLPVEVNIIPRKALESLPQFGVKRARRVVQSRPFKSKEEFLASLDDPQILTGYEEHLTFD